MNLRELTRWGFGVAKTTIEKGEEVVPVFLAIMADGEVGIIMSPWQDADAKTATFQAMRRFFEVKQVQAYAFVCECWCLCETPEKPWDGSMPSESPERVDTLMVDAWSREGEHISMMVEIDHGADGKRSVTREPEPMGEEARGQAVNLLKSEAEACGVLH